jgi:hypothetical protein
VGRQWVTLICPTRRPDQEDVGVRYSYIEFAGPLVAVVGPSGAWTHSRSGPCNPLFSQKHTPRGRVGDTMGPRLDERLVKAWLSG